MISRARQIVPRAFSLAVSLAFLISPTHAASDTMLDVQAGLANFDDGAVRVVALLHEKDHTTLCGPGGRFAFVKDGGVGSTSLGYRTGIVAAGCWTQSGSNVTVLYQAPQIISATVPTNQLRELVINSDTGILFRK